MSDRNQRDAWEGYPNQFDAASEVVATRRRVVGDDADGEIRQTVAETLRRHRRWTDAHPGVSWQEYLRADGGVDDVQVRESYDESAIGGAAGHDDDNADADGRKR